MVKLGNELIGEFEPSIGKTINVINVGKEHLSTVNGMPVYHTKSLYVTGLEDVQAHQVPIVSNKVLDALKRMSLAGNNPFDFLITVLCSKRTILIIRSCTCRVSS